MEQTHLVQIWIRERMKVHRLTNGQLAKIMGVSTQSVVNWRAGRVEPKASTWERLVALLQREPAI